MKIKSIIVAFTAYVLILLPKMAFATESAVIDSGTTAWMLTATALVLLMVPGLAMFYGGLVRTKNVLGTMMNDSLKKAQPIGNLTQCSGSARGKHIGI